MKTYSVRQRDIERKWHVIDAKDMILGKVATEAAALLMGKHKPMFCRHLDTGDNVIVINAEKVRYTGSKARQKIYYRHSGYPGGLKAMTLEEMLAKYPTRVIEHAVKGMLPRNKLGNSMIKKLRVYVGETHPHAAQMGIASAKESQE